MTSLAKSRRSLHRTEEDADKLDVEEAERIVKGEGDGESSDEILDHEEFMDELIENRGMQR